MGYGYQFFRNVLHQFFLYTEWSRTTVRHQSDAVTDTENVGVNRHRRFVENDGLNHIGGLSSYTGKFDQIIHVVGHFAVEVINQHFSHSYQMFGFIIRIRHAPDIFENNFRSTGSESFRSREIPVERRSDHIHSFIRTLCRKDYSDQ